MKKQIFFHVSLVVLSHILVVDHSENGFRFRQQRYKILICFIYVAFVFNQKTVFSFDFKHNIPLIMVHFHCVARRHYFLRHYDPRRHHLNAFTKIFLADFFFYICLIQIFLGRCGYFGVYRFRFPHTFGRV